MAHSKTSWPFQFRLKVPNCSRTTQSLAPPYSRIELHGRRQLDGQPCLWRLRHSCRLSTSSPVARAAASLGEGFLRRQRRAEPCLRPATGHVLARTPSMEALETRYREHVLMASAFRDGNNAVTPATLLTAIEKRATSSPPRWASRSCAPARPVAVILDGGAVHPCSRGVHEVQVLAPVDSVHPCSGQGWLWLVWCCVVNL